jgi:hypothetical protein
VTATATPARRRLQLSDLTRLSTVGLRTRKLRAGLSALGEAAVPFVSKLFLADGQQVGAELVDLGQEAGWEEADRPSTATMAATPMAIPGFDGHPSTIYLRAHRSGTASVC